MKKAAWLVYQQLSSHCEAFIADTSVRAVVFRGAGGQAFVAGTVIEQSKTFSTGDDGVAYEAQIEACIERRGGTTSTLKDLGGKSMAMAQGMSGIFASDEVVKGTMASYTFEHMEIASYQVLAATAGMLGDHETKQVCEAILREEQAMADWLKENLESVATQFLQRAETPGATAKH